MNKNYLNVNKWRLRGKDAKRRRAKFRRQRITRGFSDYDWWDLDTYLCNLLSASLYHLADNTISWSPGLAPTFEDYKERIKRLAEHFDEMAEWEERHPVDSKEKDGYAKNNEQLYKFTKETFNELAEVFWSLWD